MFIGNSFGNYTGKKEKSYDQYSTKPPDSTVPPLTTLETSEPITATSLTFYKSQIDKDRCDQLSKLIALADHQVKFLDEKIAKLTKERDEIMKMHSTCCAEYELLTRGNNK